jgi:hypothetical protein
MNATINIPAFKAICREICANLPALLAERNPIYPDKPMYQSAFDAVRTELADRRAEWALSVKPPKTLRDYELDFAAAARRAQNFGASHSQVIALAKMAFREGNPSADYLTSGMLTPGQAQAYIRDLIGA